MIKNLSFNPAQWVSVLRNAKHETQVWGRATGKSTIQSWKVKRVVETMPRSNSVITGKTYTQILKRTLHPMIAYFEKIGYVRDKDFFIGHKPPKEWKWKRPYESPESFDRYIVFGNPKGSVGFNLASQDRPGSGRGLNLDFEFTDETLTLDFDRYNQEISKGNRGNLNEFGHIPWHHGSHHSTSMPLTKEILMAGNYYEQEAGIRYLDEWNKIVKMYLDLLEIDDRSEKTLYYNEILRKRRQIIPFVSKDGVLFSLANVFDNIKNVGYDYIMDQYRTTPRLIFLTEVMNMVMDKVEDCYYAIDTDKHIYYNSYDYSRIDKLDYDFKKLGSPDSTWDSDTDSNQPLKMVMDWGSNISWLIIAQDNALVDSARRITKNYLKEFYAVPQTGHVMIDDVVDNFCHYYRYHNDRTVIYYKDKYGDAGKANTATTYNQQAMQRLRKNGWNVIAKEERAKEPPHHDKYLLWTNVFKENNPKFPIVRINGNNCKYMIIAMQNTRVEQRDGKFKKDKSSEHKNSKVPVTEATHSTDAADKLLWVDSKSTRTTGSFVPSRLGNNN